jgi:glutathione S-transferase
MLTLHYAPGTIAGAVAIALNEAQIDYVLHRVDFANAQQRSADFLAINPKGRVPVLDTPRGVLTETAAILDYIAAIKPDADLVPADPFEAAQMRAAMIYFASTMHVNHAHGMRGARWADQQSSWDDMKQKVPQTMRESAAYVEKQIMKGPFVMGKTFSLADPYLFMVSTWLPGDGVDIGDFPKLASFHHAMWERPSVRMALSDGIL